MSIPTIQRISAFVHKSWFKRGLLGFGVFLLLFGLFAHFALPDIIKSQAEKLVAEKLHRQLSIEHINVSPYSLALDLDGVKLLEPDGKALFASFDHLHLNVSLQSLFRFAPVVKEVQLDKPYVHLARTGPNHYNIDDIIALILKPSDSPARFAIHNLQVNAGHIEFDDRPEKARHVISELNLGIPFLSTLPSQVDVFVEPHFSAKINGAPLQLSGKARTFGAPKEAELDIDLDRVDLTRYVGYLPYKPQNSLRSGMLDLHLTVAFQQTKGEVPKLVLKGTAALKSVEFTELDGKPLLKLPRLTITTDDLNVMSSRLAVARIELDRPEVQVVKHGDGSLNLSRLEPPPERKKIRQQNIAAAKEAGLQLALGELVIRGAHVDYRDERGSSPLRRNLDKLDLRVTKTEFDLQKQSVSIAAVSSSSAEFSVVREKIVADIADVPSAESTPAPAGTAEHGYSFSIGKVAIGNWSARWEDRGLAKPAVTTATAITLGVQNLSNLPGSSGKLDLKAQVNKKGQLAVSGDIALAPLHADLVLDLQAVDLMPLQPLFTHQVNLQMASAALSSKATLKLDQGEDGALKGAFNGNVSINDVATADQLTGDDFLRWKSLSFDSVSVQLAPLAVNIDQITLDNFFARVIVSPEGRINLQDIVRGKGEEKKSLTTTNAETPAAAAQAEAAAAEPAHVPPVRIRQLLLKRGSVLLSDTFVKPNYTARVMDMGGTVLNLSSDAAATADVELHGLVNSAPLSVAGRINPLSGNLFFDLKANVRGMELPPLTAYSRKYFGYEIEKGALSMDLAYHLENRRLEAKNHMVLNQLTFGDKVDSPNATTLPVQLAVALLRDSNGVIDIDLPVSGSLDDPQFSVGGVILHAIANLITKAVTAPFAFLGSMFGGGEELSWLEFDPGRSRVPATGTDKLDALAKALNDRPALTLDITGRYDSHADQEGLRRAGIERKVRALKRKQLAENGESGDADALAVTAEEYPALLAKVYKDEDFSKPRNLIGMQKDLPVEEMEKLMMANAKVGDEDLVALANRRALAVKDWLVKNGRVPAERVFVIAGKSGDSGDKAKGNRADFSLR